MRSIWLWRRKEQEGRKCDVGGAVVQEFCGQDVMRRGEKGEEGEVWERGGG